jgi:hypothetical protein
MAKKKTIVQEFKELIDDAPKAKTLTEEQFKTLKEIYEQLTRIRRGLDSLEGEESISMVMFKVGSVFNDADRCEDAIRDIINSFEEDCDECDDDNF